MNVSLQKFFFMPALNDGKRMSVDAFPVVCAPVRRRQLARGCRGFTLIELMLAITIFAMVVGVVFSAFQVGISAWQGGERDIVFNQSMRSTAELLFREISGTYAYKITPGEADMTKELTAFVGDSESLLFVSNATLQNRIGGVSLIEFWVDDENGLMVAEAPALFTSYDELIDMNLRTDEYAEVVSPWVIEARFSYFERDDASDDGVWHEQWDPRDTQWHDLPQMVEVSLLFKDVRDQEIEHAVLIPIMSTPF